MRESGLKEVDRADLELLQGYREIFELSPDIIFIHDLDGTIIDANKAAVNSTGYSRTELMKMNMADISLSYPKMYDEVLDRLRKMDYAEFRGSHRRKDGTYYSVEAHVKLLRFEDNEIIIAVDREITEQLQKEALDNAQREIRESIASSLDIDIIMKEALIKATQSIGSEAAYIAMKENDEWVIRYIFGLPSSLLGTRYKQGTPSIADLVYKEGGSVVINDVEKSAFGPNIAELFSYKSVMAVPLITRRGITGALSFQYVTVPTAFTETQLDFAIDLSTALSLAIDNSRLYEETKRAADRLSQIMNTTTEGIMVVDRTGSVTFMNASVEEILGISPDDMIGEKYFKVGMMLVSIDGQTPSRDAPLVKMLDALTSPVRQLELNFTKRDGTPLTILVNSSPILNKEGGFEGAVISFIDITERKRYEKALNESLVTSRDIVENLPIGLTIYRFEPPNSLILQMANMSAGIILHTDLKKEIGKEFNDIWKGPSSGKIKGVILGVAKSGRSWKNDNLTIEDPAIQGSYSLRVFPLPGNRVCLYFENVTQRILQEELRRKALEQIERNIEYFAALVDEIRNPLSVISGLNELNRSSYSQRISVQIEAIERILRQLDEGWIESEKIRGLLRTHI